MKRLVGNTIAFTIFIIAALFDQDGAQVGVAFYDSAPLNAVAHFMGNLMWIVGLVYLAVAVGLFMASTKPLSDGCKGLREATIRHKGDATTRVLHWISIGVTVLLVGSGFWFVGMAMALAQFADWAFVESYNQEIAKRERREDSA
jgi:hypothetical protein